MRRSARTRRNLSFLDDFISKAYYSLEEFPFSVLRRETFAISLAAVLLVVAALSAYVGVSLAPVRTVTRVQSATATTNQVYKVTFEQVQYCGEYNILPWGVSIEGLVQVQPRNQSLPLPTNTLSTIVPDKNLTQMAFYLPPETYSYTPLGGSGFEELYVDNGTHSGTVTVNGSDAVVNVGISLSITCTSTTKAP